MKNFYFSIFIILLWSCQFEAIDEGLPESTNLEQETSIYKVQAVDKTVLHELGLKMKKRIGFDLIQTEQMRTDSDFIFDFESSLLTSDTLKRKTYTVPFLEIGDLYSTFNLVIVSDSSDNLLSQYVLQYELDSNQYQDFQETQNLLSSGVTIKRFPFSSFFNDSNAGFLERCQGISDDNGDPIECDQITINSGSGSGGGGSGSGTGGYDVVITPGSAGSTGPTMCTWTISYTACECDGAGHTFSCGCPGQQMVMTIKCNDANLRKATSSSMMECMNCDIDDFGTPAFTPTKISTAIDRDLGGILTDFHLQYLSNNPTFANDFRAAILTDLEIDVNAALFTISAGMNGAYYGNFNPNFGLAIEGLMIDSEADLSNDILIRLFQIYFEVKYAILSEENPSWTPAKLYYETAKEALHLSLDVAGLIPGFGEGADLLNAGLYFIEGDRLNGGLSLTAAIPFVGWYSTAAKGAVKFVGFLPGTTKRMSHVWGKVGNNVIFGGTSLRNVIQLTDPSKHAHHIIPLEHIDHPLIQKAAKAEFPFHINEFSNGIAVDIWQNTTHPNYNDKIFDILEEFNNDFPSATPEQAKAFLEGEMEALFQLIQSNPSIKIDRLIF